MTPWLMVRSGWPGTLLRLSTELVRLRNLPMTVAWTSLFTLVVGAGALWRLGATRRRPTAARSD